MLAMEEMNGRCMPSQPKPLKVMVANSKRDGSTRDPREDEKLVRLFIICPKSVTEKDLRDEFEKYGDLDHVTVIRDRATGESKGFGYVKYHRPYHAALAYERCNISSRQVEVFKPKFAEPQRTRDERENNTDSGHNFNLNTTNTSILRSHKQTFDGDGSIFTEPLSSLQTTGVTDGFTCEVPTVIDAAGPSQGIATMDRQGQCTESVIPFESCELQVMAPVGMTGAYLSQLFGLVPGLQYCDLNETTGVAYAVYETPHCAAYARDKLNGFEYPMGSPLWVRFADVNTSVFSEPAHTRDSDPSLASGDDITGLKQRAAVLLEQAGIDPQTVIAAVSSGQTGPVVSPGNNGKERVNYCNIPLPVPQPLVPDSCPIVQRLFIVCQPFAVSEPVLRDAFSRFGNLIDVFLLAGRNYGYAKYATKDSAMKAIQTLHGQNLSGQRIKVLEAEPPKGGANACPLQQTA